jgi:hypothetical protein
MRLTEEDFSEVFGEPLSRYVAERAGKYEFQYQRLTEPERDDHILQVIDVLLRFPHIPAGEPRRDQWQAGWEAHLHDPRGYIPAYFGKYPVVRWRQDYIKPVSPYFEYNSLAIIQDWLFDKYFRTAKAVYEFGCGTGHNLPGVRRVNPDAVLWGLDWVPASQALLEKIGKSGYLENYKAAHFDFFSPFCGFELEPGAAVFTCAALEQTGDRYVPFVQYLLEQKPEICIHIEPIGELLDERNLLDYLSLQYARKRDYLSGFLSYLQVLEAEGRLKIEKAQRTYIGSLFIDGYSVVVWKPL